MKHLAPVLLVLAAALTSCEAAGDDATAPTTSSDARPTIVVPASEPSATATPAPTLELVCEGAISWDEAASHAGAEAVIQGPVASTHFAEESRGQPTFLNVGNPFPDRNRFTVVIWNDDRPAFPEPPETAYDGKTICVAGVIEMYEGVPEIVASSPDAIAVID